MHAKVVLSVSFSLIIVGTLLVKLTENVTWLGAFFHSVSARTAGFSTYPLGRFSDAGLLVLTALMFIGASPGSTGGGIKTSTFFVLLQGVKSAATNKSEKAFHYSVPKNCVSKSMRDLSSCPQCRSVFDISSHCDGTKCNIDTSIV